jgi:hypothetical protein
MSDKNYLNVSTRNGLTESFSMDIFNRVFTLTNTNKMWLKLHEILDDTSDVHEKKTLPS